MTCPSTRTAPGLPAGTASSPPAYGSPTPKRARPSATASAAGSPVLVLEWRRLTTAQHDVPLVAKRPLGHRRLGVPSRAQAFATALIGDRLQDWVARHQRITRKVHLGDEPAAEMTAEK